MPMIPIIVAPVSFLHLVSMGISYDQIKDDKRGTWVAQVKQVATG